VLIHITTFLRYYEQVRLSRRDPRAPPSGTFNDMKHVGRIVHAVLLRLRLLNLSRGWVLCYISIIFDFYFTVDLEMFGDVDLAVDRRLRAARL